ncbi:MAG: ArsB/NhaD family transporter [Planctomycetota bacterium]|jgi:Na+/H+ antiporter NhaD/arsenite permease-like protein|nr:ArsB/NhaD family transporter [Planctomycetota bacterium]
MTGAMIQVLIIFVVSYALIASEKIDKIAASVFGVLFIVLLGLATPEQLFEKVDLDVVFLLSGMMMVVSILARTGLFEWVAIILAQRSKGFGMPIVINFLIATALLSALLDNVTTVILMAPITILVTQILEIPTAPVLICEAIFSNIGGTATLIGDPPNVVIASRSGFLTFNDFIIYLAPCVALIAVGSLVIIYFLLRKRYEVKERIRARLMVAHPEKAIIDPQTLKRALPIFALIIAGFIGCRAINLAPGLVALIGALLMVVVCRIPANKVLEQVDWDTIYFFLGLFMLIGAFEVVGLFEFLGQKIVTLTAGNLLLTTMIVLWASALVSAAVNNIPLVIAMMPLLAGIIPTFAATAGLTDQEQINRQIAAPLYWALALGACLGGNGTLIGASANVVVAQIGNRNRCPISFGAFTKYGLPLMLLSIVISTGYLYLAYFWR